LFKSLAENVPEYSVVIPVFNSEKTLEILFGEIEQLFNEKKTSFEVIFVDDSSIDNSLAILKTLKSNYPETLNYITLNGNHGQHKATFCGILHTKGDSIITLDDDLETPTSEIAKLISNQNSTKSELVYGLPETVTGGKFRGFGGYLFKKILSKGADSNGKGSSFRLFKGNLRNKF
jgi:glycosyltransferase involved in cell wall biosynthesis